MIPCTAIDFIPYLLSAVLLTHSLQNLVNAPGHGTGVIAGLQLRDLGAQSLGARRKTPRLERRFHSMLQLDSSAGHYKSRESLCEKTIYSDLWARGRNQLLRKRPPTEAGSWLGQDAFYAAKSRSLRPSGNLALLRLCSAALLRNSSPNLFIFLAASRSMHVWPIA
jgi:hypothetical protein